MAVDAALVRYSGGIYDFTLTNGDYTTTAGLDTAIIMSLFCDRRADTSEVPTPQLQRGWWGNLFNDVLNYEQGSKLWLLSQAKLTNQTLIDASTYVRDGLQWLLDNNYVNDIVVETVPTANGREVPSVAGATDIRIDIQLFRSNSETINIAYQLWSNTPNAN